MNKTQSQQKKEIIKVRAEINEIESGKKKEINENKTWFFGKISKVDTYIDINTQGNKTDIN